MAELTNLNEIRRLCEKYGFNFSKNLGQNFIINPGICPKICDAAGINEKSRVLEIGPGFGTLTKELCKRAEKVVALEVDKRLFPVLEESLYGFSNVKVIENDVLKADLHKIIDDYLGGECVVCANLPYYITSPVLMRLLEEKLPIKNITAMVQKEAAERITAKTGTRQSGAISYAISYYSDAKAMFKVNPGSFYPAPKVISTVIKMDVKQQVPLAGFPEKEKNLFKLVKAAFSQRRKTLVNAASQNSGYTKEELANALVNIGLSEKTRAEELSLQDYINLENALYEKS